MTEIYLVRHGETDWNLQRRIQGTTDIPLNDTGRLQAAATGELLARRSWDSIVSSPLSRALETARIISERIGLDEPELLDAMVERNYGEAEGLTYSEIDERFPDDAPVSGRETREEVAERVVPALAQLAERHRGESIVVVTHGGVIRAVHEAVDPLSAKRRPRTPGRRGEPIRNGSVHSFRHTDGTFDLIAFDDPIEDAVIPSAEELEQQNAVEARES